MDFAVYNFVLVMDICNDDRVDRCNLNQQDGDDDSVSCNEVWQEVEEDTEAEIVLDIVFDDDDF